MWVCSFYCFLVFSVWQKILPKWDLGLHKKYQAIVRLQMLWQSSRKGSSHQGQRVVPEPPEKRTR